ncbi:chromate efflux transporter [Brevundimonas vesicularis]|uniref:chromate efflux transporter n=1 Tax=Brevundimonas vesicularis TaxID=41276 RepID=UPI0038D3D1C2
MSYAALFLRFLKFGFMAFGGPVAQIGMLRRELVEEEAWMSGARFNRLLAILQVLPGPEAHELSVHLGMRAKGRWGGILAGLGFMLPGFVLMLILSGLYFLIDFDRSWIGAAFLGVQAAVVALIVRAAHRIGQHILLDRWTWGIAAGSLIATLFGVSFWLTLPAAGLIYALAAEGRPRLAVLGSGLVVVAGVGLVLIIPSQSLQGSAALVATAPGDVSALVLFLSGLKAGLLTFGGAYTAIPFLRADAVRHGWMSDGQFLDGLALSGVLPAPLIIFSTFIGYVAGGLPGAFAITAGIFLPAFAFSLIFYDRLEILVEAEGVKAILEGVAAGVVGLIAATALQLIHGLLSPADSAPLLPVIGVAALMACYLWKSKFAPPIILGLAGIAGAFVLAS